MFTSMDIELNAQDGIEKINEKIIKSINYLKNLNVKKLFDDRLTHDAILYLAKSTNLINYELFVKNNIEKIFADILLEIYKINSELNFEGYQLINSEQNDSLLLNQRRIDILNMILYVLNIAFLNSVVFTKNFVIKRGLESHILLIRDEKFVQKTKDIFIKEKDNFLKQICLNIYIMSKSCEENLQKWIELDTVNVLSNLAKINSSIRFDAYLAIANIANDKQIENLHEIHTIMDHIHKKIKICANDFMENKFNRHPRQITENDLVLNVEVHCTEEDNGTLSSILVYLSGLYCISVNDKLRNDIFFKNEFNNDLKIILFRGNEIEMTAALRLYAQLSFNYFISNYVTNNKELVAFLENLMNDQNIKSIIKHLCKQIFWNIEQNKQKEINNKEEIDLAFNKRGEHIMISYNSASRDLCLKIKSQLESNGHKVWIDIGNIHGSSLDSMAKAVENSFCVLICITEKYRQSLFCQAEAQYAFKLKKPIVPLIMQKGYENVTGWLGIIISDKIFINFTKYSFEECIQRLKLEIDSIPVLNKYKKSVQNKLEHEPVSNSGQSIVKVEDWNENRVKEWFEVNKIDEKISKQFFPCNGIFLQQLYEMRCDAPEFYFQSLNKNNSVELKSIIMFTHCLKKLFTYS